MFVVCLRSRYLITRCCSSLERLLFKLRLSLNPTNETLTSQKHTAAAFIHCWSSPLVLPDSPSYPPLFPRLSAVLKVKSRPDQVSRSPPPLGHASLSERSAFISVMGRWTPPEISLLLSHLANSFHGLSEKENKTWHIYEELVRRSGSDPPIWPDPVPAL